MKKISFKNRNNIIIGNLHLPNIFDEKKKYASLVIASPGSSVKEQISAIYASKLEIKGFIVLVFDPSHQGESEGYPRDLEDPATRAEDIRCAVDYLMSQSFVDEDRVGLLGICAGGGYAVHAALTEYRFKAIATVVASNIGQAFRQMLSGNIHDVINEVCNQRTIEARKGIQKRVNWIPESLEEARESNIKDADVLQAIEFYRESNYRHPNSTNRLLFKSYNSLLSFDSFHLVPDLLIQPLQVIVAGRRGTTGQFENGECLFNLSSSKSKEFIVIEEAGHYDMYYKDEFIDQAIDKLANFFNQYLNR